MKTWQAILLLLLVWAAICLVHLGTEVLKSGKRLDVSDRWNAMVRGALSF